MTGFRRAALLAGKDLRLLIRARLLLVTLILYPLVIALLLGSVLLGSSQSTRIALVNEDNTGSELRIGKKRFSIDEYRAEAKRYGVQLVDMDRGEAMRALDEGQVAGVLVIPRGFMGRLSTLLSPSELELHTGDHPLGRVVSQRVRGVAYRLNLRISKALVDTNVEYLRTLVTGGDVSVMGREFEIVGLKPAQKSLERVRKTTTDPQSQRDLDEVIEFADESSAALSLADNALEATATPVRIKTVRDSGKTPQLTARGFAFATAVMVAFACMVLSASLMAGERDERVLARLLASGVRAWHVTLGKLVAGAATGVTACLGLFAAVAIVAPQAWTRLPLLLACVAIAALAFSAAGMLIATIAPDSRAATLIAVLVVLPLAPIALLPAGTGIIGLLNDLTPLAPAQRLFNAVLFERDPWEAAARGSAHLIALTIPAAGAATLLVRRLGQRAR